MYNRVVNVSFRSLNIVMRIPVYAFLFLGVALFVQGDPIASKPNKDNSLLECLFEDNPASCLAPRLARELDQMEMQVTGRQSELPLSAVIQQTGDFVAGVVNDLLNPEEPEESENAQGEGQQEEGRGKKIGKKKHKQLQKLLGLAMLFKAKLSLLLQLISTHFQLKFFVIAVLSLIINAVRLWFDLKNAHPAKVIYYEHAQHQHHYDHDDHEHSYWGRSSNDSPQDLAYSAYASNK